MWQHFRELDKTNERESSRSTQSISTKKSIKEILTALQELAGKIDKGNIATASGVSSQNP